MVKRKVHRESMRLSADLAEALERLASSGDRSKTQVVEDAIRLLDEYVKRSSEGWEMTYKRRHENGRVQEVQITILGYTKSSE